MRWNSDHCASSGAAELDSTAASSRAMPRNAAASTMAMRRGVISLIGRRPRGCSAPGAATDGRAAPGASRYRAVREARCVLRRGRRGASWFRPRCRCRRVDGYADRLVEAPALRGRRGRRRVGRRRRGHGPRVAARRRRVDGGCAGGLRDGFVRGRHWPRARKLAFVWIPESVPFRVARPTTPRFSARSDSRTATSVGTSYEVVAICAGSRRVWAPG